MTQEMQNHFSLGQIETGNDSVLDIGFKDEITPVVEGRDEKRDNFDAKCSATSSLIDQSRLDGWKSNPEQKLGNGAKLPDSRAG